MKLIHAADIHLGRRRLDGRLPDTDFADAFRYIADQAIAAKAGAFLLAGDLFDRPQVEPPHLRQAQEILARLKAAAIPVIAVAGNHDKAFLNSDDPTWLDYLADDELLLLLATQFGPEGPVLERWTSESRRGAWMAERYSLRINPGDRRFAMLSGGEQTKLALAMTQAIIQEFSGLQFCVF